VKQIPVLTADRRGFTLVEVIVTIVLSAIASVLLIQFMGGNMERSLTPLIQTDQNYRLVAVMENITAHYKNLLLTDVDPLGTLDSDIRNGNVSSNTPYFGVYETTTPELVQFTGNVEASCNSNCRILRVDLQQGEHRLTALFTN
jgi:prepilin-type N-terminal cleavage/methylation domain-containing protein